MTNRKYAAAELIFAGLLWGFGFVATIWALQVFTTPEVLTYRFVIATLAGEIIALLIFRKIWSPETKQDFIRAAPAGLILAGFMTFQTWGLQFTTATNSGFITVLYVIFVPFINSWFFKNKARLGDFIRAFMALLGAFILINGTFASMNLGDLLSLICAIIASLQIIYIGAVTDRIHNPFRFNNFQSFWCLIGILPLLLFQDGFHFETSNLKAWSGVLILALGCSVVAFFIQVRAQKVLSDSTASMIFLLESPFAAFFGFLLLSERLSLFQTSGALVILLAAALQVLSDRDKETIKTPLQSQPRH